jgi:hypothetical protein
MASIMLESAHSPRYANEEGDYIILVCKFAHLSEELEFGAYSKDTEAHGRDIYNRAKAEEFGPVEPYMAPPTVNEPPNVLA